MLELSQLSEQVQAMSREIAVRRRQRADLLALARRWLTRYADLGEQLRHPARSSRTAIPTAEPFDHYVSLPAIPECFTVIAADGSQIQPDRHGAALYHLINVGSIVYRHGSGQAPVAYSHPTLGYTDDDLYENGLLVDGNLLDVRRDLAEITRLAELCAESSTDPQIALIDGTLLLWVLEERANTRADEWRRVKVLAYLEQLQRIHET
ncbi:MAG TPA: DNA double-strand break repair nuclease NurA, partial [Chloroflexi bacterium]|nr:DNA double-strand break repair nuclease NurA [Chloroflexota bacterium]